MYEWPQKSTQACQAFHAYFIGTTCWSTQPVLAGVGTKCQRSFFNLTWFYLQHWSFLNCHKTVKGPFWCVNYLLTWLDVFAGSYVYFTPPPPKTKHIRAECNQLQRLIPTRARLCSVLSIQFRGLLNWGCWT